MRFAFAAILSFTAAQGLAEPLRPLSQNCIALVAYQVTPEAFRPDVALAFEAFVEGSQIGRRAMDVLPAFVAVCTEEPTLSITGAMRKVATRLD